MKNIDLYQINVTYSVEDACFIARVPAFAYVAAHGDTPEEAIHEVRDALIGVVESMEAHGEPTPDPDTTAVRLRRLKPIIKMSHLAQRAGMRPSTLASKVERGGPFTESERSRIDQALALD